MKAFPFLILVFLILLFFPVSCLRAQDRSISVTAYVQPQISYIVDGEFIIISTNEPSGILFSSSDQSIIFPQTNVRVKVESNRNFLATISF